MKEDGPGFCGWCGGPNKDCICKRDNDDDCYHEDSEVDILTGRAHCHHCGDVWYPSRKEFTALRGLKE